MNKFGTALSQAMAKALKDSGFVNITHAQSIDYPGGNLISSRGDCPCGLGSSSFWIAAEGGANTIRVYRKTMDMCREHIEDDRAAGLWVGP